MYGERVSVARYLNSLGPAGGGPSILTQISHPLTPGGFARLFWASSRKVIVCCRRVFVLMIAVGVVVGRPTAARLLARTVIPIECRWASVTVVEDCSSPTSDRATIS